MGFVVTVVTLALVLLAGTGAAEEWYDRDMLDCYQLLAIEKTADTADITRAVRRVTSRTHPDRCATPECAVSLVFSLFPFSSEIFLSLLTLAV